MADLIDRQAAIEALHMHLMYRMGTDSNKKRLDEWINNLPSVQPEIIRCKDCKKAPKCYGDVLMKSKGGGYIYCPVEYCSEAERRTNERA